MSIFDDLEAEEERLQAILEGLDEGQWATESGAPGWSVADVVLHLAQSEEGVVVTVTGIGLDAHRPESGLSVDEQMARLVESQRDAPERIFQRWRTARVAALAELRAADPGKQVRWIEAPLKPSTGRTRSTSPSRSASTCPTPTGCGTSPGWRTGRSPTRSR
jgi:uncharacterized protein (TIGR03083 family)